MIDRSEGAEAFGQPFALNHRLLFCRHILHHHEGREKHEEIEQRNLFPIHSAFVNFVVHQRVTFGK